MFVLILQRILGEAIWDLVYFPLWWYSRGMGHAAGWCVNIFKSGNANLAPGLWLKNLFTPMFGQNDWQGRIISFFMRLVNVIGRGIALFVWLLFSVLLFLLWLALPLLIIYSLYHSFKLKI